MPDDLATDLRNRRMSSVENAVRTARLQRKKALGIVLERDDADIELVFLDQSLDQAFGYGVDRECDRLAVEVAEFLDPRTRFHQEPGVGDEKRVGKINLRVSTDCVHGRLARDIDSAICHKRDSVLKVDRHPLDFQIGKVQRFLYRLGYLNADIG